MDVFGVFVGVMRMGNFLENSTPWRSSKERPKSLQPSCYRPLQSSGLLKLGSSQALIAELKHFLRWVRSPYRTLRVSLPAKSHQKAISLKTKAPNERQMECSPITGASAHFNMGPLPTALLLHTDSQPIATSREAPPGHQLSF